MTRVLYLVSGKQGSGKTTTADALQHLLTEHGYDVYRTRYAKVLYEMHDKVRDTFRNYGIAVPNKMGLLLQLIGTEVGRQTIDQDVWVKTAIGDIKRHGENNYGLPDVVIIDDLRFKNEFTGLEEFAKTNGYDLRRVRLEATRDIRKARCDGWRDTEFHASETDLDDWTARFEMTISTDTGSPQEVAQYIYLEDFTAGVEDCPECDGAW